MSGTAAMTVDELQQFVAITHRGWLTLLDNRWCNTCETVWPCASMKRLVEVINANAEPA